MAQCSLKISAYYRKHRKRFEETVEKRFKEKLDRRQGS